MSSTTSTTTAGNTGPVMPPAGARLVPMDLDQAHENDIFHKQRVVCGWNSDKIPLQKAAMDRGDRTLFWITLPTSDPATQTQTAGLATIERDGVDLCPVGHISLDKVDLPDKHLQPDPTLASGDGEVMTITSLFVLPQCANLKLGGLAMGECERLAQEEPYGSPRCKAVTLTTLDSRYMIGGMEGPDGMGRWATLGAKIPTRDVSIWYRRRGYVQYKVESRFRNIQDDGSIIEWYATFMRKELR